VGDAFALGGERGVTRRYAVLVALQEFAIWLPLPVLVLHLTDRGFDLAAIGFAFALRAVFVVLLEVPTGGLADAIGRKPIALASQAATFVSFVALLFVGGPAMLLVYAVFQGIGSALHSGALEAWYVDRLGATGPDVDLQHHLATIGVVQTAAMLAGAALGGALPALFAAADLPWPLAGFGVALAAGLLLRLVVVALTALLVVEPEFAGRANWAAAIQTPAIVRDGFRLVRRLPTLPWLLLAGGAMGWSLTAVETFWQPIAALTFGADPATSSVYGALGFVLGASGLLGSLAVMRYGDRFPGGPVALAAATQLLKAAAMLLLAAQAGGLGVAVGLGLAYIGIAAQNAPHDALLNRAVPSERRSIVLSIHSLVFFGGIALGSSVLGVVASAAGPALAMAVAGVGTAVATGAYVGVAAARRRAAGTPAIVSEEPSGD
jgi:predicted MFS family arabinose efflux permease